MTTKDRSIYLTSEYRTEHAYFIPTRVKFFRSTRKLTRLTTGNILPGYRALIKAHANATTALSGTYQSSESTPVVMWVVMRTTPGDPGHPRMYTNRVVGYFVDYSQPYPSGSFGSSAAADALAYMRFNKKVQSVQRAIEGGVLLGELKETLHMLKSPAKSLFNKMGEYVALAKKRSKGTRKKSSLKKVIGETWLEQSFGWKPFINDIQDAYEAYQRIGQAEKFVKISAGGYARKKATDNAGISDPQSEGITQIGYRTTGVIYEETHSRVKGEVYVRAVTNTQAVLQQLGLTVQQFIPTVWELLPWSFLVDYFTNIGDILSYDNRVYSDLAWWCNGRKTDLVTEAQVWIDPSYTKTLTGNQFVACGGTTGRTKLITRTISRGVDTTILRYRPSLQFTADLSDNQLLNISALLAAANSFSPQRFHLRR